MQYINPFHLFQLDAQQFNTEKLVDLKGQLDAQFATYFPSDIVNYYGTKLSLSELKRCFRELEDPQTRAFHAKLLEQPDLLRFLEYGHLNYLHHRATYQEDPELMEFVAPYFAHQYSETLLQAIKVGDREQIAFLAKQQLPFLEQHDKEYYYDTARFLDLTLQRLQGLKEDRRLPALSERELVAELPDTAIEIYNLLPDYFNEARSFIGNEMGKLALQLLSVGRKDGAIAIIKQALKLKMELETAERLKHLLKQLNPGWGRMPLYVSIGLGVIAALYLLKWLETTWF